jgi:hypothetical protein
MPERAQIATVSKHLPLVVTYPEVYVRTLLARTKPSEVILLHGNTNAAARQGHRNEHDVPSEPGHER